MKLFLQIILTTSLFAQDNSNKISYTIETTSQYYQDVSIDSVYGLRVELYDRILKTKLNIPIAEIKSLKQNGLRSNIFATIIGTAAGAGFGAFAAFYAMMIFHSQDTTEDVAVIIEAKHLCVASRGIKDDTSETVTVFYGGVFNTPSKIAELQRYIKDC